MKKIFVAIYLVAIALVTVTAPTVNAAITDRAQKDVLNFTRFAAKFYSYYSKLPWLKEERAAVSNERERYKEVKQACEEAKTLYGVKLPPINSMQKLTRDQFRLSIAQKNLQRELLKRTRYHRDLLNQNLPSSSFLQSFVSKFFGISDPKNLRTNILHYADAIILTVKQGDYGQCSKKMGHILAASQRMEI